MSRLDDLKPSETQAAIAYASLCDSHQPRSALIGGTNLHACSVCDEIWPCEVAIILASYREFRRVSKRLAERAISLAEITRLAARYISRNDTKELIPAEAIELIDNMIGIVERMKETENDPS